MSGNSAYITRSAACLPNAPVENDAVEAVLGQVGDRPSRARRVVQRSNGIRRRHYVLDPETRRPTHTNASLTAQAVKRLAGDGFALDDIAVLACGTSNPDQLMPNHGVMVHGELGAALCEVVSTAGVCLSGTTALKYAWMSVLVDGARNAVATGSEAASLALRSQNYAPAANDDERLAAEPQLAFGRDFLRWMLSDGAGALLVEPAPRRGLNLRIDWIDVFSFAHVLEPCMVLGARKEANGRLTGWAQFSPREREAEALFALTQDVRLLNETVVEYTLVKPLARVKARRDLAARDVSWFLPHISSEYFRAGVAAGLERAGLPIAEERWFTNLASVGNTGSAAIYLMLDELLKSGRVRHGERLLGFVPESARFSSAFIGMTAIAHA